MGFSATFLGQNTISEHQDEITQHIANLMQSVAPSAKIPDVLVNVQASNLNFGVPMNWALNDADRQMQICKSLRKKLNQFEPRLVNIQSILMGEIEVSNLVNFTIQAEAMLAEQTTEIELETSLSLFDHALEKAAS